MTQKNKLELTWIGKENQPRLEPRILIEVPEKSFGDKGEAMSIIRRWALISLINLTKHLQGGVKMEPRDPYFHHKFNGLRECPICICGRLPKRTKLLVYIILTGRMKG